MPAPPQIDAGDVWVAGTRLSAPGRRPGPAGTGEASARRFRQPLDRQRFFRGPHQELAPDGERFLVEVEERAVVRVGEAARRVG